PLPAHALVDAAAVPDALTIHEGAGDRGVEALAFEGRPAAFGQYPGPVHGVGSTRVDEQQVGSIAFAQVATALHVETHRGRVAGRLDQALEAQLAFGHALQGDL